MRPATALAGALTLALAAGSAFAAPPAADLGSFRDWRTACDNTKSCMAIGFNAEETAIGPYLIVRRDAGPGAEVTVSVVLSADQNEPKSGDQVVLSVTGGPAPMNFRGSAGASQQDSFPHFDLTGAQALSLIAAIKNGSNLSVSINGKPDGAISLAGSSAALRWLDDRQGRAGGVTALVATGPKPASAVPAAPAVPMIALGPEMNQDNLPLNVPAALANRADVKACAEEQADPAGDFGGPEAQARLTANEYLWMIPCGRGAYNFSSLILIARADGTGAHSPGLGDDDTLVNAWYDATTRRLGAFSKGRGFGDCGQEDEWAWDGARFQATRHARMDECRAITSEDWLVTWRAQAR